MPEFSINARGLTLRGIRSGNNKPPLIALHGWLDNAASFSPLASYIQDYELISIDLPGHGHSDHLPTQSVYHFIDSIHYLAAIQESLDIEVAHILGHSMGGAIACLYAACFPERVDRLIIIEGLGPLSAELDDLIENIRHFHLKSNKISQLTTGCYPTVDDAATARARKGYIQHEQAKILAERGTKPIPDGVQWRHDPKLYLPSPMRLTEEQVCYFLAAITAPLLFIKATDGFSYAPHKFKRRLEMIKDLSTVEIQGGHHVHMEQIKSISAQILSFLHT